MGTTGKTEAIRIRPGLGIYKQPQGGGRGSPYWHARVYMCLDGRYIHTRTTRTTDTRDAMRKAEDFWAECKLRSIGGSVATPAIPVPAKPKSPRVPEERRFDRLAEHWLDTLEKDAGSDPTLIRAWKDHRYIYLGRNGLAAFFKGTDVADITSDKIREFRRFAVNGSKKGKLASSTVLRTQSTLSQILTNAVERGLLDKLPTYPPIKHKPQPRPWFDRTEYRHLYRTAWRQARRAKRAGDMAAFDRWMAMADFAIFMVGSYLRHCEWQEIRNKHVEIINGDQPHLRITVTKGKRGGRTTHSQPSAVAAYQRIRKRVGDDPEAFLFQPTWPNRQTATEKMRDAFFDLTVAAGLRSDTLGRPRPQACLRHSAMMFSILDGVPLHLLAKNAGTSVLMIEQHYGSHLEVEMMLNELHGNNRIA